VQKQKRHRKPRPPGPRKLSRPVQAETLFLGEMSRALMAGVPLIDARGTPEGGSSLSSFEFPERGLRGCYDASTGLVVGARFDVLPHLASAAWGDDAWFAREFTEMTPPPRLSDLRGSAGAAGRANAARIEDFEKGDAETVTRLSLADFLTAFSLRHG
jgi:hypothetical protein